MIFQNCLHLAHRIQAVCRFFNLRQRILAQAGDTEDALPVALLTLVSGFERSDPGQTANRIWPIVMDEIGVMLWRASLFSLLTAVAGVGSVVVGIQILRIKNSALTPSMLGLFIALFLVCSLLSVYGNVMGNRYRGWLAVASETALAKQVVTKLHRVRHRDLQQMPSGSLKVLVSSDVRNVADFINIAVRNVLPVLTLSLVALPLLSILAGWSGLAGFGAMLILIPIGASLGWGDAYFQRKIQHALDRFTSLTGELVGNIRLIRYLDWEIPVLRELRGQMRHLTILSMKQSLVSFVAAGLSVSWWMLSISIVALSAQMLGVAIDLPQFFGTIWLITILGGYLMYVPITLRYYAQAEISAQRLQHFLGLPEQQSLFAHGPDIAIGTALPTALCFEQVSFQYDSAAPILNELSFTLDLSRKTALLGEVSSGKTTLLDLVAGNDIPTSGKVLVVFDDGRRLDLWHPTVHAAWRRQLALVPQYPFLSHDDLLTNITLDSKAPLSSALDAAYAAELEADLAHLPDGIETEIGEDGVNLSGGQRQRVNLARALCSGRRYLLLDDPTSAVDPDTEQRLIATLMGGTPFLLVSHRADAVAAVDDVLVLRASRLVEAGTPTELGADPTSYFSRMRDAYDRPVNCLEAHT
jgi:ATP-binding cassette subfamily B multidrug efflux pump